MATLSFNEIKQSVCTKPLRLIFASIQKVPQKDLMTHITIQVQLNATILLILIFIPKSFWSLGKMEKCHYLSCMERRKFMKNVSTFAIS